MTTRDLDGLIRDAGRRDSGKGLWLNPVILRLRDAPPDRIEAALRATTKALYPTSPRDDPQAVRLPDDFQLEYIEEAITALTKHGFTEDADKLLKTAGELALQYSTHVVLEVWHDPRPFRAALFATGRLKVDGGTVDQPWAEEARELSKRVQAQRSRQVPLGDAIETYQTNVRNDGEDRRRHHQNWADMLEDLRRYTPLQVERDLVEAVHKALQYDDAALSLWVANGVAETPRGDLVRLRAVDTVTTLFIGVGSRIGAAFAATAGRRLIEQTNIRIEAGTDHPAINGKGEVNGTPYQLTDTDDMIKGWNGFKQRADLANRLDYVRSALSDRTRGEAGREITILAATIAVTGSSTGQAVTQSRAALRQILDRTPSGPEMYAVLDSMVQGLADVWDGLTAQQQSKLGVILQEDVQRHTNIKPLLRSRPDSWISGANINFTRSDGSMTPTQFVPPETRAATMGSITD